jgi:archaellum component FlaC
MTNHSELANTMQQKVQALRAQNADLQNQVQDLQNQVQDLQKLLEVAQKINKIKARDVVLLKTVGDRLSIASAERVHTSYRLGFAEGRLLENRQAEALEALEAADDQKYTEITAAYKGMCDRLENRIKELEEENELLRE